MSLALERGRDIDTERRGFAETAPHLDPGVLEDGSRESFHRLGRETVAFLDDLIARWTGQAPRGGRVLDFGCGVGWLTEAMASQAAEAFGYDTSEVLIERARARVGGPIYTTFLPDGPFDWINSHHALQHIAPERGMKLLEALLARLAPGGAVSLQITTALQPAEPPVAAPAPRRPLTPEPIRRAWLWLAWFTAVMINPDTAPPRPRRGMNPHARSRSGEEPVGAVSVFDYDLTDLLRTFREHGVFDVALVATDHAHPGYIFIGRKAAASPASPL